jgi:L-fuconolactonase
MFDSHAHIVTADTAAWPVARPDDPAVRQILARAYPAEALIADMDAQGVARALVVQRGQIYGFDNRYVLAAAAASGGRLRAVCGVDAGDPGCAATLHGLHRAGAAGFRLMARPGATDFAWLDGDGTGAFWPTAAALGLPVCVHLFGWNRFEGLVRLAALLHRHRVEHVVIDHFSNAPIAGPDDCGIDEPLRAIAGLPGAVLKFSSIPLNALAERGIDATPVIDAYLDLMGRERLIWGSDITQSAGSYATMVARGRVAVAHLPAATQDLLLNTNTARLYRC